MPTIIADSTASTSSINALPPLAALQAPLRILKRPSPSSATPSQSDADAAEGLLRGLSLREREAQYHAARARIFGSGEELTSSPVGDDQDGMDGTSPELTSSVNVTPVLLVQASNSKEKVEDKYTNTGGPGRGDKTPEGGEEGTATIGSTLRTTTLSAALPPVAVGDGASLDLGSDSGSGQGARRGLDLGTPSGEDGVHHVQALQDVPVPSAVSPRSPAPGRTKSGGEPAHAAVTVTVLRQPRGPSHPQQSQSQSQNQDQAQVQLKNASAFQGANSVNGNSRGGGARGFGGRGRRRGGGKHGGSGSGHTTPSQSQKQTRQSP